MEVWKYNNLALKIVSAAETSSKMVKKKKKKKNGLSKSSKFCVVWTIRFCSNFTSMWYKHVFKNVRRDLRLSMSALATVAGKSFNGKFNAKN